MTKSMTGFGSAEGTVGSALVSVEIRSVNHRFFNPSIKLPSELSRWEPEVRDALRRSVSRGHVTLLARVQRGDSDAARIDEKRFGAYVEQIRHLQERFGMSGQLDVGAVLRLPNIMASGDEAPAAEGTAAELVVIVDEALGALARIGLAREHADFHPVVELQR